MSDKKMSVDEMVKSAHYFARNKGKEGKEYKYHFMDRLIHLVQSNYDIQLSQSEITRFEKDFWKTIDHLRDYGKMNTGQFLKTTTQAIKKLINDKRKK